MADPGFPATMCEAFQATAAGTRKRWRCGRRAGR